jgi:FkbM family methyltransferase
LARRRDDTVFDMGFHKGEDTDFYLAKGYRVVSLEADPKLHAAGCERFADAIAQGRLTIVNKALVAPSYVGGEITFYQSTISVWGTVDPLWAERNTRLGASSVAITVKTTTMPQLLAEFGVPFFVKLDIEGMDLVGLEGLAGASARPAYVSIESEKDSFKALRKEFMVLRDLGYDRFKIVPQSKVPGQQRPRPAKHGGDIDYTFPEGASGLFGEEAPGAWMSAEAAIEAYKDIFFRYALVGDDPIAPRWARSLAWRLGWRADWYDTHAKLAGEA